MSNSQKPLTSKGDCIRILHVHSCTVAWQLKIEINMDLISCETTLNCSKPINLTFIGLFLGLLDADMKKRNK